MATPAPPAPDNVPGTMLLILALTLDGRSVDAIVKYLRQNALGALRAHRGTSLKQKVLHIQRDIRDMSKSHQHPDEPEDAADAVIEKVVDWCIRDQQFGLTKLARSKEFDMLNGDKPRLRAAAHRRKANGLDIATELGYTEKWLLKGGVDSMPGRYLFKQRLLQYWSTGAIQEPESPDNRA